MEYVVSVALFSSPSPPLREERAGERRLHRRVMLGLPHLRPIPRSYLAARGGHLSNTLNTYAMEERRDLDAPLLGPLSTPASWGEEEVEQEIVTWCDDSLGKLLRARAVCAGAVCQAGHVAGFQPHSTALRSARDAAAPGAVATAFSEFAFRPNPSDTPTKALTQSHANLKSPHMNWAPTRFSSRSGAS